MNRCVNTSPFGIQIPTHFPNIIFPEVTMILTLAPFFARQRALLGQQNNGIFVNNTRDSQKKACKLKRGEATSIGSYLKCFLGGRFINKREGKKSTSLYKAHTGGTLGKKSLAELTWSFSKSGAGVSRRHQIFRHFYRKSGHHPTS